MATRTRTALIAQSYGRQDAIWHAALQSQGVGAASLAPGDSLAALVSPRVQVPRAADLLVVDLAALAAERMHLDEFCAACRRARPATLIVATLGCRLELSEPERLWARTQGAHDLWPEPSLASASTATVARFAGLATALELGPLDFDALRDALRTLAAEAAEAEGDVVARLASRGIDASEVAMRMRASAGVPLAERRYRLKWYPGCFVGSEAVDWLVRGYGLTREEAVELGQYLLARGVIHHVVKEQPFTDGAFFYRFGGIDPALDAINIAALVAAMRDPAGLDIRERTYLGRAYANCFVGREAVDWMAAAHRIERESAVTLGQRLVDLRLLHHVLDEHAFVDGYYFYRFLADERR